MVRKVFLALVAVLAVLPAFGQNNVVRRYPKVNPASSPVNKYQEYTDRNSGFFWAAELMGGYSCRLNRSNFGFVELDAVAGYRINEYLNVGAGLGGRYYFDNDRVRYSTIKWGVPLFVDVRGQFIPSFNRNVVPYYSFDIGGTFRDGFMMRPTLGLRIGENRSAFLIGLAYTGQQITSYFYKNNFKNKKGKFASFITLKIGYQF